MRVHAARLLSVLALVCLLPGAAWANHQPPAIMFDVLGGGASTQVNGLGTATALGDVITWTLTEATAIEGVTIDSWSASMKEDPFVTNNIVVTNNTGVTQTFIATVLLPIPAFNYNEVVFSSLGVTGRTATATAR